MYIDYYSYFLNSEVKRGNRNNILFLAGINAFFSKKAREVSISDPIVGPLIEKALQLKLTEKEIINTLRSAQRYNRELHYLIKNEIVYEDGKTIITDDGAINQEYLFETFQFQVKNMFQEGDQICLANIDKINNTFTRKLISYEELLNNIPEYELMICNPTNNGISEVNIDRFRNCLLECDELPLNEQIRILKDSFLPIKMAIYSGNKSIHCICDINANDLQTYRQRVDEIYAYAESIGFKPDKQCRNANRFVRIAGAIRNNIPQILILRNNGITYEAFHKVIHHDITSFNLEDLLEQELTVEEPVISGLLREKQCMMLFGASKSGKTFLLIQLACCLSCGGTWLDTFDCKKGNVLYVNMEVDDYTIVSRFKSVINKVDAIPANIHILSMRGFVSDISTFETKINSELERLKNINYIIVDPIYKISADENKAVDVKAMFNFFDKLMRKGYTIIFCHHTHKNYRFQDISEQFSGSSVFARAVDVLVSISPTKFPNQLWFISKGRSFNDNKLKLEFKYPIHLPLKDNLNIRE